MTPNIAHKISIGSLASSEGLSAATLRYYEKLGLIESQSRSNQGTRYFPSQVKATLKAISRLKKMGFTLREVLDLQRLPAKHAGHQQRFRRVLEGKLRQQERELQAALKKKAVLSQALKRCVPKAVNCACDLEGLLINSKT